jgi:hypothetical protein
VKLDGSAPGRESSLVIFMWFLLKQIIYCHSNAVITYSQFQTSLRVLAVQGWQDIIFTDKDVINSTC